MKKLLLIIALLISALGLNAQSVTIGSLEFTVTSETPAECEVSGYSGEPTDVTIPSTVTISGKEYTVTSIGYVAFEGCSSLTSIEIPSGVTYIGWDAFSWCYNLTSIEFGENSQLTSIVDKAFWECNSLKSIEIPSGVTSIGNDAFYRCYSLKSIEIPSSVTSIGEEAFFHCDNLTSIEIPSGVTSIGVGTFDGCSSLTIIEIPSSVTSIGALAFNGCDELTSIEIPSSVTSIGDWAFNGCSSLTSIYCYAESVPETSSDAFYNSFYNCPSDMVIYVPEQSVGAYKAASPWNEYTILAMLNYEIAAVIAPSESGVVNGAGTYNHGEEITLTATANEGYKFINWTENGEVVSEEAEYSFEITKDRNLVANFELLSYNVTALVNPENAGVVNGAGTYNHGEEVALTATANEGYKFINWTENGEVVSEDAQYSFVVTSDRNLVANFEKKEVTSVVYNVTTVVNPENVGVVIGSGVYYEGDNVILTAIPIKNGYEFVNWTEDGKVVSEDAQYSFVATSDRELVANFVLLEYYVTAALSSAEAGEITGDGNYNHGEEVTLTATAHEGYKFVNWTENGVVVSEDAEYSFAILKNRNLVANFSSEDIALNVVATAIDDNTIKVEWNAVESAESYNVYRASLTRNSEYEFIANVKETSFTDTGLDANTKYFYSVTAVYADGSESEKSESAEATTKPESIEELSLAFNIYPNPVSDKLYIETEVEVEEVVVYAITGVIVGQQSTVNSQQSLTIDVTNLNSGVYFVKIVTENGESVQRFIKK